MPPRNSQGETANTSKGLKFSPAERRALYAAQRFIGSSLEQKLTTRIPFDVYFQDPEVAGRDGGLAFDSAVVPWEPNLGDGPTSARFAVVDYDGHTGTLTPPVKWESPSDRFLDSLGQPVGRPDPALLQSHQVNVWAILQRALDFFESGFGLGRRVPWAFAGNRLSVVPHAGVGQNAYYDRKSKSLQFYYFDVGKERIFTCLSTDIIHHEFGHAVLDGIRPLFLESVLPETAAFHEFVGDLTAILIALRNNEFRKLLIVETQGRLANDSSLSRVAEQFGKHVGNKPYLRNATNPLTMSQVANSQRPHHISQVLTGAMFDIIIRLSEYYAAAKSQTDAQAFWNTIQRMQFMALQPLDLLPPVDVTFRDYALAVLRAEEVANPVDPDRYREMMLDVFVERGIVGEYEAEEIRKPRHVFERLELDVFHDVEALAGSRADAYRFLDDNRRALFIPANADITIVDLSTAQKLTREARRLPRQILLQYVWREDVVLEGERFGRFDGSATSLLCGGTLALNQNGEMLAWARKPGSEITGEGDEAAAERDAGAARRSAFLDSLAMRIRTGRVGKTLGSDVGLLERSIAPLTSSAVDGEIRFELSPHFRIDDDDDDAEGGRAWQISS